jgi:DNA-binding MarR family transcriptional regulator
MRHFDSRLHMPDTANDSAVDDFAGLIDEIYRLNGRLVAANKMTTRVAGLRPTHWIVFTAIARAVEPPTVPRIGRALGQSRQGIQRVADDLVSNALVEWIDNPDHKRAKRLILTGEGRKVFEMADEEGAIWMRRVSAGLDAGAVREARQLLQALRRNLEQDARSQ